MKKVFLAGLTTFVVASLLCALSPTLLALTVARIIQGLGASAAMSVNIALIRFLYPAHRLGRGLGLNALVATTTCARPSMKAACPARRTSGARPA